MGSPSGSCARRPRTLVVDPAVMGRAFTQIHDQYAAEHLVEVAAGTVRDVARMQSAADAEGKRLLTFTLEAEVRFAEPGDVHRFTDALTEAVRRTVEQFDTEGGRPYRLIAGGHPAPRRTEGDVMSEDRPQIVVTVAAPVEAVWDALRDKEKIRHWHGWEYEGPEGGLDEEIDLIYFTGAIEEGTT